MKMKKNVAFLLGVLLISSWVPFFTGCEAVEPPEENVPEEEMEWSEKVQYIYDHASYDAQEVTTVHQLAILTSISASLDDKGPITVTPSHLNKEAVTLVTLGGTQMVEGQATGMQESQLASFGKPNDYLTAVVNLFKDGTIPASTPVVLTGISLGGMIAQQLLSVAEVLESHEIRVVITFGSPLTLPLDRHGVKVVRFTDKNDKVPQMGELPLNSGMVTVENMSKTEMKKKMEELNQQEKILEESKYSGMLDTHALSYISEPCWDPYDFMGEKAGKNVLVLDQAMKFYAAPKISK